MRVSLPPDDDPTKTARAEDDREAQYIDVAPGAGHTRIYLSTRRIVLNNFVGGLAWGVGSILGGTVLIAALVFVLAALGGLPVLGELFRTLIRAIQP